MAGFNGWTDCGMIWHSADSLKLGFEWIALEMIRQAMVERCEAIYPTVYGWVHPGMKPGENDWKNGLLGNLSPFLNPFPALGDLKGYIDGVNRLLNRLLEPHWSGSYAWGIGPNGSVYINDGQNSGTWQDVNSPFHVEGDRTILSYPTETPLGTVQISCDASLSGNVMRFKSVTAADHSYGAPTNVSIRTDVITRDWLVRKTDADNIDWYGVLQNNSARDSVALRKWFFQVYKMLNLLRYPAVSGSIGFTTTIANPETVDNYDDYKEQCRWATVYSLDGTSLNYYSGQDSWEENITLEEAWRRAKWVDENGCGYAYRSHYVSLGSADYYNASRRRQWYKLMCGNSGTFANAVVQAKQEAYLQPFGLTDVGVDYYSAELGGYHAWRQLIDAPVPSAGGKSALISIGDIDSIPPEAGAWQDDDSFPPDYLSEIPKFRVGSWQAEIVRTTITAELKLWDVFALKFKDW